MPAGTAEERRAQKIGETQADRELKIEATVPAFSLIGPGRALELITGITDLDTKLSLPQPRS